MPSSIRTIKNCGESNIVGFTRRHASSSVKILYPFSNNLDLIIQLCLTVECATIATTCTLYVGHFLLYLSIYPLVNNWYWLSTEQSDEVNCGNNCRQEEFDKSAAGRAARAQQAAISKQSANTNRGEPVLKVLLSWHSLFRAKMLQLMFLWIITWSIFKVFSLVRYFIHVGGCCFTFLKYMTTIFFPLLIESFSQLQWQMGWGWAILVLFQLFIVSMHFFSILVTSNLCGHV